MSWKMEHFSHKKLMFQDGAKYSFTITSLILLQNLWCDHSVIYFMLFGSLSENNGGLSLDNLTVSISKIISQRANRLLSVISGGLIFCHPSI